MTRLGIVTGLLREAEIITSAAGALPEEARPLIFCAGGGNRRAQEGAISLAEQGITGLLSFGVAGGLDPTLGPGSLMVADRVVSAGGTAFETDKTWRQRISTELGAGAGQVSGAIAGVDHAITTIDQKATLRQATGAGAVDMESLGVARAAAELGLPFLVIRAIADTARHGVPRAALAGLRPDGSVRVRSVLAGIVLAPWEIPDLVRLARADQKALEALRRVAALALPTFLLG